MTDVSSVSAISCGFSGLSPPACPSVKLFVCAHVCQSRVLNAELVLLSITMATVSEETMRSSRDDSCSPSTRTGGGSQIQTDTLSLALVSGL